MKKKRVRIWVDGKELFREDPGSVYMGGERDRSEDVNPRFYESFFSMKMLYLVLVILTAFSAVVVLWTV